MKTEKKQMNFQLTEMERQELKQLAKKEMLSVSSYIRRATLLKKDN